MQVVIEMTEHEWEYLNKLVANGDILGHYERLLVNGTPLHENATNGDVIKAMFPYSRYEKVCSVMYSVHGIFALDWWNAQYKDNVKGERSK